jgi:hypothetical protein
MTPTDSRTKDGAARHGYADPTPNPFVIVSDRSPELMVIVLVSSALTVAFTRLFLELTGYPQIGNSTFHIAHALCGGLALFLAGVMVLIVQNRGSAALVALLTGVGFGLLSTRLGSSSPSRTTISFHWPRRSSMPLVHALARPDSRPHAMHRRPRHRAPCGEPGATFATRRSAPTVTERLGERLRPRGPVHRHGR